MKARLIAADSRLRRRLLIGLIIGLGAPPLVASAVLRAAADPSGGEFDPDAGNVLLRIAGDDASTGTIIPPIAAAFLETLGASGIHTTRPPPPWSLKVTGNMLAGRQIAILIRDSKTANGLHLLAQRKVDVATTGRPMTPQEAREIYRSNDIPADRGLEVARYALVVAVNSSNPVKVISLADLRAIYSGRITDWRQLGGRPAAIHVYGRQAGSAARDAFLANIMNDQPFTPTLRELPRFVDLNAALAGDRDGVGYLSLTTITGVRPLDLSVGSRLVPKPTDYSLGTGDYLLGLPVTLYRRAGSKNDAAAQFFQEMASPRAEVEIALHGLALTGQRLVTPRIDPPLTEEYRALTDNGLRVSTTIRFAPGSPALDAATTGQMEKLAMYLRHLAVRGDNLALVGYSDSTGNRENDRRVSKGFAELVANGLRQRNAYPGIIVGFGSDLPLADDAVPAGRRLNRRVETWIRP